MADALTRFVFEHAPVKGGVVQLTDTWHTVLSHADYPPALKTVLGELLAAAALLTSGIKFDGSLVLQVHGKGPVKLIVVEATSQRTLRATAKWEGELTEPSLAALVGQGRFVITLDQSKAGKQNYQGIVPLEGQSVADILSHYMASSEQLDTRIYLAASDRAVGGMLLQKLPDKASEDDDTWNRVGHLAATLTAEELLTLSANDILLRLFHEETLRRFEQESIAFRCTCSRESVGNMLKTLGRDEIASIIAEQHQVEVGCEFCDTLYVFDAVDAAQLFIDGTVIKGTEARH
ncbi:MAG TPA: Hsp33 family molecular chaperone HslO [Thiobacillaceae bacterium]|nr:Hsp33 family molecular chaperone HslO [Thiobacillaceae bacterium]